MQVLVSKSTLKDNSAKKHWCLVLGSKLLGSEKNKENNKDLEFTITTKCQDLLQTDLLTSSLSLAVFKL